MCAGGTVQRTRPLGRVLRTHSGIVGFLEQHPAIKMLSYKDCRSSRSTASARFPSLVALTLGRLRISQVSHDSDEPLLWVAGDADVICSAPRHWAQCLLVALLNVCCTPVGLPMPRLQIAPLRCPLAPSCVSNTVGSRGGNASDRSKLTSHRVFLRSNVRKCPAAPRVTGETGAVPG
jgi:hypothetical protein